MKERKNRKRRRKGYGTSFPMCLQYVLHNTYHGVAGNPVVSRLLCGGDFLPCIGTSSPPLYGCALVETVSEVTPDPKVFFFFFSDTILLPEVSRRLASSPISSSLRFVSCKIFSNILVL